MPRGSGGGEYRIDAREFSALLRNVKAFDNKLAKAIRKELREAAKPAIADVRSEVRSLPTKGRSSGVRDAVAAGVGLRVSTAVKGGAVTITASSRRLPAKHKAMNRLLNKRSWRHPVFGDRNTWAVQTSTPYFQPTIARHTGELRAAVVRAIDSAVRALKP